MAKLRMAHAGTHGARKPPGPKEEEERLNDGDNNAQATHGARKHAWRTQAAWAKRSNPQPTTFHPLRGYPGYQLFATLITNFTS